MADDVTTGAEAPSAPIPAPSLPADVGRVNAREAGNLISEWRAKQVAAQTEAPAEKTEQPRVNGRFASAAAPESAPEGADAGPDNPVPSETTEADPAEQPPIEPPRSWSKEDKELFANLPRETQERVSERERSRESDFLRRQNEATEKTKALEAKERAADEARQQYESAAQNALSILQSQQAAEFSDIKTHADVQKLAADDPFRFAQWQARQIQIQAQAQEVESLSRQRQEKEVEAFKTWSKEQDDKFTKAFPEFSDSEKGPKVRQAVSSYLTKEVGVPEDALPNLWNNPLFRDAMFQRVIYDASRFHAAQQGALRAAAVPKPPVLKPGTAPQKGAAFQEEIAAAQARLTNAKGISALDAAAQLMAAKRKAARR